MRRIEGGFWGWTKEMWIKRLEERQAGVIIIKREKLVWGLEENNVDVGIRRERWVWVSTKERWVRD